MSNKKILGQFFTTNYEYILQRFYIPDNIKYIIEPFAGNCDLLNFITNKEKYNIECYDIDVKDERVIQRDTLINPPEYNDKFIITNPPYLARNKCSNKLLYTKYNTNDLYKCFIKNLLENMCCGGIIIIPLNFWSSIRKADVELRRDFLNIYNVLFLNIFCEKVFEDTSYNICSFQFVRKDNTPINPVHIKLYPTCQLLTTTFTELNNYMIGGDIYKLTQNTNYKISRLTSKNINSIYKTNILVKCIDDNDNNKICLKYDTNHYIDNTPNQTARTYATLLIDPKLDNDKQKELVSKFNEYLDKHREKYYSLFLTNYRENNRKRISFDLVYSICYHIVSSI